MGGGSERSKRGEREGCEKLSFVFGGVRVVARGVVVCLFVCFVCLELVGTTQPSSEVQAGVATSVLQPLRYFSVRHLKVVKWKI
jgi:hypothetical protein